MRFFLIPVLNLMVLNLFAQTDNTLYKTTFSQFEKHYNAEKYDSVFVMFSPEMQRYLPVDKTKEFLSGLKSQVGRITQSRFTKFENTYALYKTNFERALFGVYILIDSNSKINGLFIKPFVERELPKITRNSTKLQLPIKEEWTVVWGGDTKELNYHIESEAQKNAFDLVITDKNGKSYQGEGQRNEDYYAFGKPIMAPCDGEVVLVVDGIKDNKPSLTNPNYVPGNTVIIRTADDEYLFFAHFKQHSIKVKQGQKVKQGKLLGLCGNSGNSSEPHLHFHIQNIEDMNMATGVKCYFNKIWVNGELKKGYSPIKGDKIRNE